MRSSLHLAVIALAAAAALGTASVGYSADSDARAAISGRHKMSAELAAAMVDGHISRADYARLLEDAQRVLSPADYRAFAPALERLVESPKPTAPLAHSRSNETKLATAEMDLNDSKPSMKTNIKSDGKSAHAGEGSFIEEVPPGRVTAHAADDLDSDSRAGDVHASTSCNEGGECDDDEDCGNCCGGGVCARDYFNIDINSGVDAFKGPLDFGNANGNFGLFTSANAGIPVLTQLGMGMQVGLNGDFSDLKGIPYAIPNSQIRSQMFATIGLFDRIDTAHGRFGFGVVYDYSFDEYYSYLQMGQWRGKMSYEFNPWNEFGVSASVAEHGATAELTGLGGFFLNFKPLDQGFVYWTHKFANEASLSGRFGVAETPGQFLFGATGKAPLTSSLSMVGDFTYIMPSAPGGPEGQTQETWNLSLGMEFKFGGPHDCMGSRFAPFIPVADNGSFALRQLQ